VTGAAAPRELEHGGLQTEPARRAEPYLDLRATVVDDRGRRVAGFTVQWLPKAGLIRAPGEVGTAVWIAPSAALVRALERAGRGLRRLPAEGLGDVRGPGSPEAQVVEVFRPAGRRPPGGASPEPLGAMALFGAAGLAVAVATTVQVRRRRMR
jgi:hypothetical protein